MGLWWIPVSVAAARESRSHSEGVPCGEGAPRAAGAGPAADTVCYSRSFSLPCWVVQQETGLIHLVKCRWQASQGRFQVWGWNQNGPEMVKAHDIYSL